MSLDLILLRPLLLWWGLEEQQIALKDSDLTKDIFRERRVKESKVRQVTLWVGLIKSSKSNTLFLSISKVSKKGVDC